MTAPLAPGATLVAFHEALNFTRLYGSFFADQPLEALLDFSNDETAPDGDWVKNANIDQLNYDAKALKQGYDPVKQEQTGKFFGTIYGRWLRVTLKNLGDKPVTVMRTYVRGSVF